MLEIENLCLIPGSAPLTGQFRDGEITVVLGRNSSGKTRLARIIAGFEHGSGGRLLLDGEDITTQAPGRRSVALVYQAFVNYPSWTVAQNLASPMLAQRLAKDLIRERVASIATQLEISSLLDRYPAELSGGQQQRVAIGRALAKSARVLVLDEPLVNLDYKLRESLQLQLRALLHEFDMSVIYTTSDPRDVFALGDTVMLLADHALVQTGTPLEVYERPTTPLAADLMSDPAANRLREGKLLRMVRPEHLELKAHAADDVSFATTVLGIETNGSETYLHCEIGDLHGKAQWVAKVEGLIDDQPGHARMLYAAAGSVLVFEADV